MSSEILENRRQPLLAFLRDQAQDAVSVGIAVAFVKSSGWQLLENLATDILVRNGTIQIIFGLDFRTTEPRAIRDIMSMCSENVGQANCLAFSDFRVAQNDTPAFHPKIYLLEKPQRKLAFSVGSSNLTRGGLRSNVEVNFTAVTHKQAPLATQVSRIFQSLLQEPTAFEPDGEFLQDYEQVYRAVQRRGEQAARDQGVRRAVRTLKRRAGGLRRNTVTQLDLVTEAIREITQHQEYARLRDIQRLVRQKAEERGISYDWDTFHNSIRGRLNTNVVGKPTGRELFERPNNRPGQDGIVSGKSKSLAHLIFFLIRVRSDRFADRVHAGNGLFRLPTVHPQAKCGDSWRSQDPPPRPPAPQAPPARGLQARDHHHLVVPQAGQVGHAPRGVPRQLGAADRAQHHPPLLAARRPGAGPDGGRWDDAGGVQAHGTGRHRRGREPRRADAEHGRAQLLPGA